MKKEVDVSVLGETPGSAYVEANDRKCEHFDECQLSTQVLFYLDACRSCEIAQKFKK